MNSEKHPTYGLFIAIFVALLALLVLTVAVAYIDLEPWGFLVAAIIATVKAALIMLYFMEVRYSTPLLALVSVSAIFWLGILFAFTLSDYFTRTPITL